MFNRSNLLLNNTKPGFLFCSETSTSFVVDGNNVDAAAWYFIPADDLSKVYDCGFSTNYGQVYGVTYGDKAWHIAPYSTGKFLIHTRSGIGKRQTYPDFTFFAGSDNSVTAPFNFKRLGDTYVILNYVNPASTWVSDKARKTFTRYANNYPTFPSSYGAYNSVDDVYLVPQANSSTMLYTQNKGITWNYGASIFAAARQPAFGTVGVSNKTWVTTSSGSSGTQVFYLTGSATPTGSWSPITVSGASWQAAGFGNGRFVIGGGSFTGSNYNAKIAYSTNGSSWTPATVPTVNFYVHSLATDGEGKWIGLGYNYDGANFVTTEQYIYSADNGSNWTAGTLPKRLCVRGTMAFGDGKS